MRLAKQSLSLSSRLHVTSRNRGAVENIAQEFGDLWQFPHMEGAIDRKHVVIEAPAKSRILYHNYKGAFSIVLLAI